MSKYRILKNLKGKYKIEKRVFMLGFIPFWINYAEVNSSAYAHTVLFDTKEAAELQATYLKEMEKREKEDNRLTQTWKIVGKG